MKNIRQVKSSIPRIPPWNTIYSELVWVSLYCSNLGIEEADSLVTGAMEDGINDKQIIFNDCFIIAR